MDIVERINQVAKEVNLNFLLSNIDERNLTELANNEFKQGEYILFLSFPTSENPILNDYGQILAMQYHLTMSIMTVSEYSELRGGGLNPFRYGRYEKNIIPAKKLWRQFYDKLVKDCKRKVTSVTTNPVFDVLDMNFDGLVIEIEMTDE